ncbi:MAG: hypothetical protein AABZ47_06150, partial [Planctomycetota bacterium]
MIRFKPDKERVLLVLLVLSCGLLGTWAIGGEQPEGTSIVTTLRQSISEEFTLEVELNLPVHVFLPGQ